VPLWCEYMVPSCVRVQRVVVESAAAANNDNNSDSNDNNNNNNSDSNNDWSWVQAALVASVVSTTARLAESACRSREPFPAVTRMLISILDSTVLNGRLETICIHPWRPVSSQSLPVSIQSAIAGTTKWQELTLEAALVVWTTGDENDEDEEEEEHDNLLVRMREHVASVETVWADVGVAILVAVGLQTERCRPGVWSPAHVWRMGFPHVATLLNANDNDSDDNDNNENDGGGLYIQSLGFQLLDTLLRIVPDQSLRTPLQAVAESSIQAVDSPIGTLQLISNRIVASAADGKHSVNKARHEPLPDATREFELMKELVGKYQPVHQVAIVRELVEYCPHPGLKPKLLDILRVCVSWGNETKGLSHVWSYLDTLVDNLQENVDVSNPSGPVLRDVTTLIDGVEVYVSALSLVHLWVLLKKKGLGIDNLSSRLTSIHVAVKATLTRWSNDDCTDTLPQQHFRLHLLESSLENTLDVLQLNGIV
jgi:hypothetical protein